MDNAEKALIEVRNIKKFYKARGTRGLFAKKKNVEAVGGVSFQIQKGETLGIIGESGCGKSVTAHSILRTVQNPGKVLGGRILYDDGSGPVDLVTCSPDSKAMRKLRGKDISMIFQEPMASLSPVYTIGAQMMEAVLVHQEKKDKKAAKELCMEMLRAVGMPDPEQKYNAYPHQMSGGQCQRAMIAIAMVNKPKILIADEPTSALDVTIQAQVMEMIQDLIEKQGTSLILITHDLGLVATSCDDVAVVYAGEIIEYGSKEEIYDHPSHPYTIGLFGAIPNLESDVRRLANIEGLPPDPSNLPTGCSFAPRCPYATEECRTKPPKSEQIAEKHYCSCYIGRQKRGAV